MTRKQRSQRAWKKWRGLISAHSESGQTITAFCRERGLSRQSFFAWKKRLLRDEASGFVEVKAARAITSPAVVCSTVAIEVRLQNGRSLVVEPGFDAGHVRALLAVLESEA